MNLWENKIDCCGCAACANICPKQCIQMERDEEGFLYPIIDQSKCISCNSCMNVCPIKHHSERLSLKKAYVARIKDEDILKISSSGGCFSGIVNYVLDQKGVVVGAVFNEDFEVIHILSSNKSDISKMRGSKYVQSDLKNVFETIKMTLKEKQLVCFVGTPCQVEGLKNYLILTYDNLITIDFVCHGVASPAVWEKYIEALENLYQSKIINYSFRSKHVGHHNFGTNAMFANGSQYLKDDTSEEKDFMHMAYFNEICSRPSCHSCAFKSIERASDLTMFDCWHVEELAGIKDDDLGYSTIIPHSNRGLKIVTELKNSFFIKEIALEKAIELDGGNAIFSMIPHPQRRKFFQDFNAGVSLNALGQKYFKEKSKGRKAIRLFLIKSLKHIGLFALVRRIYYSIKEKGYVKDAKK